MRVALFATLTVVGLCSTANASGLSAGLSGLDFLVGEWGAAKGIVAETGGMSTGHSSFTVEADGALLLRRDHTELLDSQGKPTGGFNQVMTIYSQDGKLHADYIDAQHVIHYENAEVGPGKAVTFTSAAPPGTPIFQLTYRLTAPQTLSVTFSMEPPGAKAFRPVASGTITKLR